MLKFKVKMKQILFGLLVAISLVSCLGESSYKNSYTLDVTFDVSESEWKQKFGADSTYVMPNDDLGFYFADPALVFGQKAKDQEFYGGFVMSYLGGEGNGTLSKPANDNDRFRVFATGGAKTKYGQESRTYAVFYDNPNVSMMPAEHLSFTYKTVGTCSFLACYVNNTTLVAREIKEHFQEGDKLVLNAKGYKDGTLTGESSIVLAEYTAAKDSVMYNWSVFDMTKLKGVDKVEFSVESTNPEVPGYVCIDGVMANITVSY